MAAKRAGSLIYMDDVTEVFSEVFSAKLFAQIQPEASNLIGLCFTFYHLSNTK